ncbi:MAG: hypothetical protein ABI408_02500 [Gemmatimonadaceae bacterium]
MRLQSKVIVAVLGLSLLWACKDSTAVNGDASGTYTLSAINNIPVPPPFTVQATTTDTIVVNSGRLTINNDGTFSETLAYDHTTGGVTTPTTSVCPGHYSQSGNGFTFTETTNAADAFCGGTYAGAWNGSNAVSLFLSGFTLDYSN